MLFPADTSPSASKTDIAKSDVMQIAAAVTAFETEYGQLPVATNGVVGGEMLAALLGHNLKLNPKNIVFLEASTAAKGKSGLSNGVWVDPWGAPYQIAFDSDYDNHVIAGTNHVDVLRKVAVWTDPRLSGADKPRRYITSWE